MYRRVALPLIFALSFALAAVAATSDNLQDLVNTGGSLTIGDKVFNNFDFQESGLTSFDPSQITVTASFVNGIYFLKYTGNMSFVSASGPSSADLVLTYTVTALAGQISMIDQSYTGGGTSGSAHVSIDETVSHDGIVYGSSHLEIGDMSDPPSEGTFNGDNLDINPPQTSLDVAKDMNFGLSAANGGQVEISQVAQSFHQVPEPSTVAMLLIGSALFVCVRRRRRA
jgi:PEP-CTERM motif